MIEVQKLTYRYAGSDTPALSDISFVVDKGQICGFLAPNGGGKTTLFKILATMLPVQSGSLLYSNEDYKKNVAAIRNTIGVVFQSPSIDKKLTVRENLQCQVYLYGSTPGRERKNIDKMIDLFGLQTYIDSKVEVLSGGYQRRVELAKCMLHNPAIILLDEPSSGLDIVSRREMWKYLSLIRDEKDVTILLTTHLIEEAEQCDQVIIFNKGNLVVSGTPTVLKEDIGGEILSIKSDDISGLMTLLREKWNITGTSVNGIVRVELTNNKHLINTLLTEHIDLIDSATISKPSLADVFFRHTGNKFDRDKGEVIQ